MVGKPMLVYAEDDYRVYATELEIMWRWDLFKGDRHLHMSWAHRPETCADAGRRKIAFFQRPTVTKLLFSRGEG